jgi:hypothetical protein
MGVEGLTNWLHYGIITVHQGKDAVFFDPAIALMQSYHNQEQMARC